ncbi:structural maintenance of chromosomes protein 6-like [Physella acuta]|uniref:structural maintenance of chromosomes protein 6-like n=1 Tax=Physella acuta TaxID=109671 RepID=UPI0027DCED6D|nr:structural maintenance of chromosomes protein 6-like [Physella acuta]
MSKRSSSAANLSSKETAKKKHRKDTEPLESDEDEEVIESSLAEPLYRHVHSKAEPIVGVIKKISMFNFMCHNRLDVTLGSHVNFIIGRNGSGKSAIVTALVVGLGGKALSTNRGSSIKNFIKTDKRSAWVEVTLNNRGMDSYKHDVYGDSITIRRKFTCDGVSGYSILSDSGQVISSKRDEVQRITDHLNIQVDNPVSILNQDTSRSFLNTKSAADKFKFFMKATQLEQMSSDYDLVKKNKEITRQEITSKESVLPIMLKEVKVWENKFKNLMALSELKDKIKALKRELAWSLVIEKEKGLKPLEKALKSNEAALPKFVKMVDQAKDTVNEWDVKLKELEQRLIDCGQEIQLLEPLLQEKKGDLQKAKDDLVPLTNELRICDKDLSNTRQECKQCQDRIEELKVIASHDFEADRRQREEQISSLKLKLDEIVSKKKVSEHELDQHRSAVAKYKADASQLEAPLRTKQTKLKDVKMAIRRLQAATNDRLQRYGEWMPVLIRNIQQSKRHFHKVPIGPLGACFDLVDTKWALSIESCLKALVSSFVCHDRHDEKILEDIFRSLQVTPRPSIITCPFSNVVHNVSKYRVRSERFPCVLDVIKCDNPVVINTLIDQRNIENVLLIEDSNVAREVMLRNPPTNSRECFTLGGDQVFCTPTFRYYSSDKTTARYLMENVQDQIVKLEREEKQLEEEINAMAHQRDSLNQEIAKNQQEEKKLMTQVHKHTEIISRLTFEIQELKNVEDPAPVDVTTLEEEVQVYNEKIKVLQAKRNSTLEEKKKAEERLKVAKESYLRVEASIREKSDNGIPLREEISQTQDNLYNARHSVKHYTSKLKEQEKVIQDCLNQVENYKREVEANKEKAREVCEPIQTNRTPNSIESEITQIERRINEEEEQQGNEEVISTTYKQKKDALDRVRKEIGQMKAYIDKLDEVMVKREIAYQRMRKLIASRAKYYFLIQMAQRSFTGKMNFDFTKETLEIVVNTSSDSQDGKGSTGMEAKDLKSLSGGERSFSTVCFILSLWEAMESPFRCLDEFDVFMDMVNRRISMDMMMATADMHKNMQFIFLTPQDMSSVRKISDVKIFRMQDPERNQDQGVATKSLS